MKDLEKITLPRRGHSLRSLWDHFGVTLGSLRVHFGVTLEVSAGKIWFGRANSANDYTHGIAQTIRFAM